MKRRGFVLSIVVSVMVAAGLATLVAAQAQYGSAAEAKAMLEKAVAAVKADKAKALEMFKKGEGGFKDRDLYPFCGGPDGNFTAHPTLTGKSLKDLKDKAGKPLGQEIYKIVQEGKIGEVTYKWPRPGQTAPVDKVTFVTKVGDQVWAGGYYKWALSGRIGPGWDVVIRRDERAGRRGETEGPPLAWRAFCLSCM